MSKVAGTRARPSGQGVPSVLAAAGVGPLATLSHLHPTPALPSPAALPTRASSGSGCGCWMDSPPPPSKGEVGTEPPGAGRHVCTHRHTHHWTSPCKVPGPALIILSLTAGLDPGKLSNRKKRRIPRATWSFRKHAGWVNEPNASLM